MVTDEQTRLPAGPAGQNAERGELRRAGAHRRRPLSANQTTVLRSLKRNGASSPPAMAERRSCSPWSSHLAAVERALTVGMGAQSQGGANATKDARNGGEERENRADRGVAGAPTHSGELYRTRGTHRARLSASTGCGRTRRSRWWSRRGGRRSELAGREAPSVGSDGARRSYCCCASEREGESASGEAQMASGAEADAAGCS